ncbi:hypothetical protein HU200_052927 [Digitaria exilis]|uniref:DUF7595 domain-containing protein n=1 Tax=Digitaria exilis TaxID=1010633 RepID=A0A835AKS0_9POAL|nr:hypothetical protein HU200_052927 [Digitaria exilis]
MDKEDEELPDALFSKLHPDPTTTAESFPDKHLPRFVGRSAADLLGSYTPVTSRNGLVVLRRRHVNRRKWSQRRSDLCVYNPATGERTFFSYPPGYFTNYYHDLGPVFVLLTAEDGIGCDFELYWMKLELSRDAVVLRGGRIHWLTKCSVILTYDVATSETGCIWFPVAYKDVNKLHLGTSPDGRLRLMVVEGFIVSAWLLSAGSDGWEVEAVINMEAKLRSLCPEMPPSGPAILEFMNSGEKSGVALLRMERPYCRRTCGWLIVLEVETGEMRKIWGPYCSYLLVEVDMSSRLRALKAF